MKFTCDQQALYEALVYISKYTTKITTRREEQLLYMAIDDSILTLRGTSGGIYSTVTMPVPMEISGEALVDGVLLLNIVSTMSLGDVTISGKKRLTFKQGQITRRVSTGIASDFPLPPKVSSEIDIEVDTSIFTEALSRVDFARSDTMIKPILRGYLLDFDGLGMVVATDSQRMAHHTLGEGSGQFTFPSAGAEALSRGLKLCPAERVRIQTTPSRWTVLTLTNGIMDVIIYVAALAGNYPTQVLSLVEKLKETPNATCITINKNVLLPSLKMANTLSDLAGKASGSQAVKLIVINESYITLEMGTQDGEMHDELECDISGDAVIVQMFPPHFLQILQTAPQDQIEIRIWSPFQPVLFSCGDDWTVIQAPVGDRGVAEQWEKSKKETYGDDLEETPGGDF
jgi:DNA polymerase III sliding clamp (beta) subunit (PCNA family)